MPAEHVVLHEERDCGAGKRCLEYQVRAEHGETTATFTLVFDVTRWEIDAFNLS